MFVLPLLLLATDLSFDHLATSDMRSQTGSVLGHSLRSVRHDIRARVLCPYLESEEWRSLQTTLANPHIRLCLFRRSPSPEIRHLDRLVPYLRPLEPIQERLLVGMYGRYRSPGRLGSVMYPAFELAVSTPCCDLGVLSPE